MSHITTEQALQIPQQLHRQPQEQAHHSTVNGTSAQQANTLQDDSVSLLTVQLNRRRHRLSINEYKGDVGKDKAYLKETLRNKLAEFGYAPNTNVKVSKNQMGLLQLNGPIPAEQLDRMSQDINHNLQFRESFRRLETSAPTLQYLDNVVKLTSAYGVGNQILSSIVSRDEEFNSLTDIAHRYQSLKNSTQATPEELQQYNMDNQPFEFSLSDS